jgi:protein SCO1/2
LKNFLSQRLVQVMALVTILIFVTAGAIYWIADRAEGYELNGRAYSPVAPAPPLDLTDQHGSPFSLAQEVGKVTVVSFGCTRCPDGGPTKLDEVATLRCNLGDYAYLVDFIFVTFDPENDTQERMTDAIASVDPSFIGLRGDAEQTTQVLDAYGMTVERKDAASTATGCQFEDNARVYLIDKEGNLRVTYVPGTDPLKIAQDIEHLAKE